MMRFLRWAVATIMVVLFVDMVTQIFDPAGARLAFSFKPNFQMVRYPFQYGFDSCKTKLSTVGSLTLVVGSGDDTTITHNEFLSAYTSPLETPFALYNVALYRVMGVHKSVVSGLNGTKGHAWIKTSDGVCQGNVYTVDIYDAVKFF
jgi:hypothetical protein